MLPQKPPQPACRYLPFQPDSGSQTSKRIDESLVGAEVPATRQNGGRLVIAVAEPGGVNDPVVMLWAAVIVVFGSASADRSEHGSAAAGDATAVIRRNEPSTAPADGAARVTDHCPLHCIVSPPAGCRGRGGEPVAAACG